MPGKNFVIVGLTVVLLSCLLVPQALGLPTIKSVAELTAAIKSTDLERIVFTYQTRDGISGDGQAIRINLSGNRTSYHYEDVHVHGDFDPDQVLDPGPAEIVLKLRNNKIRSMDIYVGGSPSRPNSRTLNLGEIPAPVVAQYFIELVEHGFPHDNNHAILAAVIARDGEVVTEMLAIVRDKLAEDDIRQSCLFWLADLAGEKVIGTIKDLIYDDDEDSDMRSTAIFSLSRMEQDRALPLLMELATDKSNPELQQAAFFGLARIDDPQVVELFENILLER